MADYTYSIGVDFPGAAVNVPVFYGEIKAADPGLSTKLSHVNTTGDACVVVTTSALSPGEEAALDAVVAAHAGTVLQEDAAAEFLIADAINYKSLLYTGDDLTQILLYADQAQTELRYTKDLTYSNGLLDYVDLERAIDSKVFRKTLTYDADDILELVEITAL